MILDVEVICRRSKHSFSHVVSVCEWLSVLPRLPKTPAVINSAVAPDTCSILRFLGCFLNYLFCIEHSVLGMPVACSKGKSMSALWKYVRVYRSLAENSVVLELRGRIECRLEWKNGVTAIQSPHCQPVKEQVRNLYIFIYVHAYTVKEGEQY